MRCARRFERRFLGCPPDRWSHGTFGVEELEDRPDHELQDPVDFGGDTEFESEIEAIVGALEPIEESDAIEVLSTWKQTRTAMTQEKLNRGLRTPVYQHSKTARQSPRTFQNQILRSWLVVRDATIIGRWDILAEFAQKDASKLLEQMLAYGQCHASWS